MKRIVVGYRGDTPYFLTANKRWSRSRAKAFEFPNEFLADHWAGKAPKNIDCMLILWATDSVAGAKNS